MSQRWRDQETWVLVALSAALPAGDRARLEIAIDAARDAADPNAVEEVLLQSYLFLGYPAALNALALWRERSGRAAGPPAPADWVSWRVAGEALCARVYGDRYAALRANIAAIHPDLEQWMITEGYGKVLARPGLELKRRELCVVALLAGLDAPRQLYAHLRGALRAGATAEEVSGALELGCAASTPERGRAARAVWVELSRRAGGTRTDAGPESEAPGEGRGGEVS